MQKKKKKPETQRTSPIVAVAPHPQADVFVDNIVRVIGNFGFQQILLPAVEERQIFEKSPTLSRLYGENFLGVHKPAETEMILAPTKLPTIISRYVRNVKSMGPHVSKWFYMSPVLRFENDKYVSAHELGLYVLGEDSPLGTAQLINTTAEIFRALGTIQFVVQINSLGCVSCQEDYTDLLSSHLAMGAGRLCSDCEVDFEKNPLVMWSCVNANCRTLVETLPPVIDSLDDSCKSNLTRVLESIDELNIPYTLTPALVPQFLRHQIVFQISPADNSGNPIGYGGNFSELALELDGNEPTPILGMLTTFEKLVSAVPEEHRRQGPKIEVFMVPLGSVATRKALALHRDLQHSGILAAEAMLTSPSIRNQLKVAAEKKCEIALIIGQKEAIDETVILRDMRSGMQEIFAADRIIDEVKKRLGK